MVDDGLNKELFDAIEKENFELMKQTLEKGPDINAIDNNGNTPLMNIIHALPTAGDDDKKYYEITDLLLADKQLDINIYGQQGTAFHLAASYLLHNAVQKLLDHKDLSFFVIEEVLGKIKDLNGAKGIITLIKKEEKYTDLMLAAKDGRTGIVDGLIADETNNVNMQSKHGGTALMIAAQNGHIEVVNALIVAEADVNVHNQDGVTALMIAAQNGHTEIVNALIVAEATVDARNKDDWTALHLAAQNGHTEIVDRLIAAGATVDMHRKDGRTALHLAAKNGHTEIVDRLIAAGATIDKKNNDNSTPLHFAAQAGHANIVKFLIEKGADISLKSNIRDNTSLHFAIENNHAEVVKILLEKGADVNENNKDGNTPLDLAIMNMNIDSKEQISNSITIIELLLQKGANIYDKDTGGKTFLDLVKESQVYIPLLEIVAKYKPKDVKDFLSNEPNLVKKLNEENNLGKELKEVVDEVKNTQRASKKESLLSRLVNSKMLVNSRIEELKEIIEKSRD